MSYTCNHNSKFIDLRHITREEVTVVNDNALYETLDDIYVRCIGCSIRLLKRNYNRHFKICKGIHKDQCVFCLKAFLSRSGKSRHQKTCKKNPTNMPKQLPPHSQSNHIGVQNNYINNNLTTHNNVTNHFNFNFGGENVKYILDNQDPRYASAMKNFKDSVDLVHFNQDHPENQTVRKINKKSSLMEFRTKSANGEDRWEKYDCATGIPRLRSNLEAKLNTKFEDDGEISNPVVKELLYHKSKRGNLSEEDILTNYKDLELVNQRRCKEACDVIIQTFLKNTGVNIQKTPCVVRCLQQDINKTRRKYGQSELSLGEIARSY